MYRQPTGWHLLFHKRILQKYDPRIYFLIIIIISRVTAKSASRLMSARWKRTIATKRQRAKIQWVHTFVRAPRASSALESAALTRTNVATHRFAREKTCGEYYHFHDFLRWYYINQKNYIYQTKKYSSKKGYWSENKLLIKSFIDQRFDRSKVLLIKNRNSTNKKPYVVRTLFIMSEK